MRKCEKRAERAGVKKGVLITLGTLAGFAGLVGAGLLLLKRFHDDLIDMWIVSGGDPDWDFDDENFGEETGEEPTAADCAGTIPKKS